VVFVVLSYPSRVIFEVIEIEVEVVTLPSPLNDLDVLGDVPFVVVSFLLDAVTEDTAKGQIWMSLSSDTSVSSTTFF
jgi:hypothetical protein